MNIFELEKEKSDLIENLEKTYSSRQKLILYNKFFSKVLSSGNKIAADALVAELYNDYIFFLKKYDPFYLLPKISYEVIRIAKEITNIESLENFKQEIFSAIEDIENKLGLLDKFLNNEINTSSNKTIFFPLLEEEENLNDFSLGIIESLTVKISTSVSLTNFIIIPSEKILEERLQTQIEYSWKNALSFVKDYIKKINPHHEVIISFDKRAGIYQGNSLGIALTLGFIQELLRFYNSPTIVQVKNNIAFTGGISNEGNVINTSKNIIQKKTESVFFSEINTFVVPRSEENHAQTKIDELNKQFPNKKINVIGVENLNDILNRRNLVDIHKQKLVVRSANYTKKHSVSIVLATIILAIGLVYLYTEIDTNPAILFNSGDILYVQNKLGKTLWTKRVIYSSNDPMTKDFINITQRIIDINNDGKNEVILCDEKRFIGENISDRNRVACFNSKGKLIWQYKFEDTVSTIKDKHTNIYNNYLIDTTTENGLKVLYLFTRNNILYPSSIYKLNLETGKRLPGTFWHSGQIAQCILGRFYNDKKEMVGVALNNSFERCVFFSIDLDNLNGQAPATHEYKYLRIPEAKINNYILLPKTDYTDYKKVRFDRPDSGSLIFNKNQGFFSFSLKEGAYDEFSTKISYYFNRDFSLLGIYIGDTFQVRRDMLVKEKKLNLPYSNTNAYTNILKNDILYWNGIEFVKNYPVSETKNSFTLNH